MFKNKELLSIFIVVFIDLLGYSIILPLLPYYADVFKATPEVIGYLVASYSVFQFVASPVLGGLSDKYGRRPLLIYSQIGSMMGFILLALAQSLPILFLSRIIDGISGGNLTIAQAYITDITEPKDRSGALAVIGIAFGLGFLLGPLIGGTLAKHYGYSVPALAAAGLSFISIMLSTFYLKEPKVHRSDETTKSGVQYFSRVAKNTVDYFRDKHLRQFLLVFLFFALPFALYVSMFSLFAKLELQFDEEQVGLFLAYVGLLGIIYQGGLVRPLVRRLGDLKVVRIGMLSLAIGLLALVFARDWHVLMIVALFFSFGSSVTRPTLSSLISQAAPPNRRGGALGVASALDSLSRSIAPILGGWIIGGLHPNYLGYVGSGLGFIGAIFAFSTSYKETHREVLVDETQIQ